MKRYPHFPHSLWAAVALAAWPCAAAPAAVEDTRLANPSFEDRVDARGVPRGWEGDPGQLALVDVDHGGGRRGKALTIARGGSVSQTVPGTGGRHYTVTALAHTPLVPDPENNCCRSPCSLELTFLPSGKRCRTEMASPFGESRRFVEHSAGGEAPAGTTHVRVAVLAQGAEATVDDVRLVAHDDTSTHFALKNLHINTAVVEEGRPRALIVLPASGAYDALGREIAGRIRQLAGADVPVVRDTAFDLCRDQRLDENLIVLGNRDTNRVVSDLYDLYYCILDRRYPGKGGSVVRSLHNPFGDGHNVLLIGASDEAGMRKATASFLGAIDQAGKAGNELTLGHLANIELGDDVNIPKQMSFTDLQDLKPWDATSGTGGYGWTVITKSLALYYLSGHEFYAREFLRLAFPKDEQTLKDLASCGQDFFGDHREPLVDPYHYRAHLPVVYWDLVEESPFFTDAARQRVTQQFMKQVKAYRANKDYGCEADKTARPATVLGDRHQHWGAMTFYTLGRYFSKYYPDYEWRVVRRGAENFFAGLHLKKDLFNRAEMDKLERYPTTVASLFAYTLMSGNKAPVEVGSLLDQTRARVEIPLDGKKDAWVLEQAPTSLFNQMAYLFKNSRYLRIRDLLAVPSDFYRPGQSYWPDEGALALDPLPVNRWETLRPTPEECSLLSAYWQKPIENQDRMFRTCSLRTSDDGRGDFLLFEGIHVGGVHKCFALVEHMLNGDILFMGARTQLRTMSDGMTAVWQPKCSFLERTESNGESSLIAALVPNYNGMDWERSVLHRQGRYTLFVDTLTSRENNARSTVELNWALASNARAVSLSPGCAVIRVAGGGAAQTLFELSALDCPTAAIKSSSPESAIERSEFHAIVLRPHEKGAALEIAFDTERDVEGYVVAEAVGNPNGGLFKLEMDGAVWAEEINCRAPRYGRAAIAVDVGRRRLSAGRHLMRLESLGPAPGSQGSRMLLRGFKVLDRPGSTEYMLGLSNKLVIQGGDLGGVIGSRETGAVLSAVWNGPVAKRQELQLLSLVAPKAPSANLQAGNCIAVAPNAAVLTLGDGCSIAATGEYAGLRAEIGVVGSDHLACCCATRCGEFAASDSPVDIDWNFARGVLALNCPRKSTLTLALASPQVRVDGRERMALDGAASGYTLVLEAGRHVVTGATPRATLLEENRKRLASAFSLARTTRLQAPVVEEKIVVETGTALQPAWQAQLGQFPRGMHVFQSGGQVFVAMAAGGSVFVFDNAGKLVRKLEADDLVKAVHYWPEAGVLAAGCRDFRVIAFDLATGQRRWVFESAEINPVLKKSGYTGWFDRSPAHNKGVHALNSGVFLNGRSQLLVGTACTVEALDEDGRLLQSINGGTGVVTDLALLDCGAGEFRLFPVQLFGDALIVHTSSRTPDKTTRLAVGPFTPRQGAATYVKNISNGFAAIEAADLDADGRQELVALFNGVLNGIHVWNRQGELIADAAFGDGSASPQPSWEEQIPRTNVRGPAIADLDGDGKQELVVITARGFVIALDCRCKKLWARPLLSEPMAIAAVSAASGQPGRLVVACRDGMVCVLDARGMSVAQGKVDGIPLIAQQLTDADVVIAASAGAATAYRVR